MISSFVKKQLIVFSLLAISAMLIIVFVYARVPAALGFGRMQISAVFTNGAGIYPDSNVTVRGVGAGIVKKVELRPNGEVVVVMSVEASPQIGADARAEIHSVSAVGEQYVDLISDQTGGPYLEDGAEIPVSRTQVPEQIAPVLDKTTALLASIPDEGLHTFLDEGYKAFANLGPDLRTLVDSSRNLLDEADKNYVQTSQLIRDIGPLLDTQNIAANDVRALWRNLSSVSGVLADNRDHLQSAFTTVSEAADGAGEFLDDVNMPVAYLAPNLRTVGELLGIYHAGIEQTLMVVPNFIAWEQLWAGGGERFGQKGRGLQAAFALNLEQGCTTGFNGHNARSLHDLSDKDAEPDTYCKVPHDDPRIVRGARNNVCQEGPLKGQRAATVQICLGRVSPKADEDPNLKPTKAPVVEPTLPIPGEPGNAIPDRGPLSPPPNQGPREYEDTSTSDPLSAFGASSESGKEQTWQSLLTGPVGR